MKGSILRGPDEYCMKAGDLLQMHNFMGSLIQHAFSYTMRRKYKLEEERKVIIFFCFKGKKCHGVGNAEMLCVTFCLCWLWMQRKFYFLSPSLNHSRPNNFFTWNSTSPPYGQANISCYYLAKRASISIGPILFLLDDVRQNLLFPQHFSKWVS